MKIKTYQIIRLSVVVILALAFSQAVVMRNFFFSAALLTIGSLFLWYARRRVKEIIADERDYAIAGRSALLTVQIHSWLAVILMFIFYSISYLNPIYETIAITLAFSTCALMLLYAFIFRYKARK